MEFDIVGPDAIREGAATDAYFDRTETTLRHAGRNPSVVAEVTADQFPDGRYELLAGVRDAAALLSDRGLGVDAIPPGRLFDGGPVLRIEGDYLEMARHDDLAEAVTRAGTDSGDRTWRMPLASGYDEQIKSDFADMKNTGGREAGASTAAHFLARFVKEDMPWCHVDVAGVSWHKKDKPTMPKGATGHGVRLVDRLVRDRFERS